MVMKCPHLCVQKSIQLTPCFLKPPNYIFFQTHLAKYRHRYQPLYLTIYMYVNSMYIHNQATLDKYG